jgi:hypothetical protein
MSLYRFHISQDEITTSTGEAIDLPDDRAAWKEASFLCRDLSRSIFTDAKPEWKLEVTDEGGKPIFRFRVLAEVL